MMHTVKALLKRRKYLFLALLVLFLLSFVIFFFPSSGNVKPVPTKKDNKLVPTVASSDQTAMNVSNVDPSLLVTDGGDVLGTEDTKPTNVVKPLANNTNGNGNDKPKKTTTPTPTSTTSPTATVTPTPTQTITPTVSPTATVTPTASPAPTTTPTPSPTVTIPVPSITITPGKDAFRILNLKNNLKAIKVGEEALDLVNEGADATALLAEIKFKENDKKLADFNLNLTEHRNWDLLNADAMGGKVFAQYPGGFKQLPGIISDEYSLFIPKTGEGIRVGFCPDAQSLEEVNYNCAGLYFLKLDEILGSTSLSAVIEGGMDYWKLDGLSEFGGALESTGYVIKKSNQLKFSLAGSDGTTDLSEDAVVGVQTVEVLNPENERVALFSVDLDSDKDWSELTGDSSDNKAFLHFPGGFNSQPGKEGESFSLFIRKGEGDKAYICPGAATISEVVVGCPGGYFVDEATPGVTLVDISGSLFWKVSGLTGTGGMSVVTAIKDTMDRLKIGVYSEHDIQFTTNNGLIASTDDMLITFASGFDLTGLTLTDIQLFDNSTALTLAANPAASTWGVTISTVNRTILFLAPSSTGGYIAAGHQVRILIGETGVAANQIRNPLTGNLYEEQILIHNENDESTETGSIRIPIVDSDQVDITGFVNNFMSFDIDTGTSFAADCNVDDCLLFAGGPAAANYTVDLGELVSTGVNRSLTSALHSNGQNGNINSIYLDLSSNAISGAVIMMVSTNGAMDSGSGNLIPAVASDGNNITANSGRYGFNMPVAAEVTNGTIVLNSSCDEANTYCAPSTTPKQICDTNDLPLQSAKIRIDIAVAAAYTNAPGNYSDTLTFIAIPSY